MIEQDNLRQGIAIAQSVKRAEPKYPWMREWWFRLLALLFLMEIITPFLQWPLGLPSMVKAAPEGMAIFIACFAFAFMLKEDMIPKSVLIILGISLIWGIVAVFEGQSPASLIWGWWRFFKYPLIGLFTYLVIGNPTDFAKWFIKFSLALLAFQVGVQIIMFALGFPVSDSLAGTFGRKGVMQFTMLVFFVVCIGIGTWLGTNDSKFMVYSLVIGLVGSTLSATKFYLFGVVALLVITFIINMVRGGQFHKLLIFLALFIVIPTVFLPIFNNTIVQVGDSPLQSYLNPEVLTRYLFYTNTDEGGSYVGRGYAPIYSWQRIQRDPTTTLFGYGLGSRSSSAVLGISGAGLQDDTFGGVSLTTLGTWIQEYGLIGLSVFLLIITWIIMQLFRFIRKSSDPYQISMAYGLILFTTFWPLWIWYHNVWYAGAMLILYWVSVGYILRQSFHHTNRNRAILLNAGPSLQKRKSYSLKP